MRLKICCARLRGPSLGRSLRFLEASLKAKYEAVDVLVIFLLFILNREQQTWIVAKY